MISAEDFYRWKQDTVTKEYYKAIYERIEEAKDTLATSSGIDCLQDRFICGMIQAYREIQDFQLEEIQKND